MMNKIGFVVAILLTVLVSAPGSPAVATLPLKQGMPTLAPLLRGITPGVVNIAVHNKVRVQEQNPLLRAPFAESARAAA